MDKWKNQISAMNYSNKVLPRESRTKRCVCLLYPWGSLADVTKLDLRAVSRHAVGLPELEKMEEEISFKQAKPG